MRRRGLSGRWTWGRRQARHSWSSPDVPATSPSDKPNPRTASNQAYLHHILEVGHDALLEHATATLYIRGLSRSATHELVRHRHFSFSQLSQRFVHPEETEVVLPKLIAEDEQLTRLTLQAADDARFVYEELLNALESKLEEEPNALLRKKQARQAARAVLPNLTESRIVVTGNYRAWRHFIGARHGAGGYGDAGVGGDLSEAVAAEIAGAFRRFPYLHPRRRHRDGL